jgi:hypothetical protein
MDLRRAEELFEQLLNIVDHPLFEEGAIHFVLVPAIGR